MANDDFDEVSVDYQDVVSYVDAADNLAESLKADLAKGSQISTNTILFLNRYKKVATAMQHVIDFVSSNKQDEQ